MFSFNFSFYNLLIIFRYFLLERSSGVKLYLRLRAYGLKNIALNSVDFEEPFDKVLTSKSMYYKVTKKINS